MTTAKDAYQGDATKTDPKYPAPKKTAEDA
jgi:hypothetical protein